MLCIASDEMLDITPITSVSTRLEDDLGIRMELGEPLVIKMEDC